MRVCGVGGEFDPFMYFFVGRVDAVVYMRGMDVHVKIVRGR